MKCVLLTAALVLTCSQVRNLFAQPALDRVEQRVRRQLESPKAKPPRVAPPPAALQPKTPPALNPAVTPPREPGYLGLVGDVQEGVPGVRVLEVVENAAAATAGMQADDLITSINGRAVADMDDMAAAMGQLPAGSKLEFEIQRAGAAQQLAVVLGTRPAAPDRRPEVADQPAGDLPEPDEAAALDQAPVVAPAAPLGGPRLGVRTIPINADIQQRFSLADTSGAFVNAVTVGSPADKAGITVGSIIVSADGRPVAGPDALAALIRRTAPGRAIELVLLNRGREVRRRVVLAGEIAAPGAAAEPTLAAPPKPPSNPRRPAIAPSTPTPTATASPAIRQETDDDPPAEPALPDAAPIQVLQRRIEQLEARIERLEAALAEKPAEP